MPLQRVSVSDYSIRPQEELRPRVGTPTPAAGESAADATLPGSPRRGGAAGDVPAGADPHVWLGLSVEERAFFARLEETGRLSYGPNQRDGEVLLYRGRHLHIKA